MRRLHLSLSSLVCLLNDSFVLSTHILPFLSIPTNVFLSDLYGWVQDDGDILNIHLGVYLPGDDVVHVRDDPGEKQSALRRHLGQQPLELRHLLSLHLPTAGVLEALGHVSSQQVIGQLAEVLLQEAGHRVGVILLQAGALLTVIRCFQFIDFGLHT